MEFQVPKSLKHEHEVLLLELVEATMEPGAVGEAAKEVSKVLYPHFMKEEEYAMPPLGILGMNAEGKPFPKMERIIAMAARLKAELGKMHEEHKTIVTLLHTLSYAATKANKPRYTRFYEKFVLHVQVEEEVLYPAAIMIGEYLKTKLV
jgi:iron-sulfur cluster repair protein YtfE (RIC family)